MYNLYEQKNAKNSGCECWFEALTNKPLWPVKEEKRRHKEYQEYFYWLYRSSKFLEHLQTLTVKEIKYKEWKSIKRITLNQCYIISELRKIVETTIKTVNFVSWSIPHWINFGNLVSSLGH